jgi:diguanylate cyclase (GGDEF)-like protein
VAPEGLVLLAVVMFIRWGMAWPSAAVIVRALPYVVAVAGLLLSWRFHRGRLLFALVALALAGRALWYVRGAAGDAGPLLLQFVALLLPLNLAALALLPERGVRSSAGLIRLGCVLGQAALVWMVVRAYPTMTEDALAFRIVPSRYFDWTDIGQPAILVFAAALFVLAARAFWKPDAIARGFFWAVVGAFLAIHAHRHAPSSNICLTAAGLILVVGMLENVYTLAYRDELTGLPSRRALNEAVLRLGDRYTIAMVDIDHFKQFNDRYGHDVGDQVLRMVGSRLARVEGGGKMFRYGGEEFTLLFPDKAVDESLPFLEAIRREVAEASFTLRGSDRPKRKPKKAKVAVANGKKVTVTISIGAAERNGRYDTPEQVIEAADRALYKAKEGGRNRVEA